MMFSFQEQYKDYTNTDLLKIVRQPHEYQAAAVDAATQILNTRSVTAADLEEVDRYFHEIATSTNRKMEKINSYKEMAADFLEPVVNPAIKVKPQKILNYLLLFIGLQYIWTLYINVRNCIQFIQYVINCKAYGFDNTTGKVTYWSCFSAYFNSSALLQICTVIYIPIVFILLLKRQRWGWILLFADNLLRLGSMIGLSYILFKYQQYYRVDVLMVLFKILVKSMFVFFLWRNYFSDLFGVTKEVKKKTAIAY
jgi:hypothetical protein